MRRDIVAGMRTVSLSKKQMGCLRWMIRQSFIASMVEVGRAGTTDLDQFVVRVVREADRYHRLDADLQEAAEVGEASRGGQVDFMVSPATFKYLRTLTSKRFAVGDPETEAEVAEHQPQIAALLDAASEPGAGVHAVSDLAN